MSPEGKNVQRGELRLGTRTVGPGKARVASRSCGLLAAGWIAVFLFLFTVSSFAATADLRLGQTVSAARVTLGANVTFTVAVTNDGPDAATGVTLQAPISPRATFVSTVPSQGACTLVGRTISCDLGALDSNGVATVAMTLKTGAGTNESVATITAAETDPNLSSNISTQSTVGILLQEYSNGEAILLPELDPGPASIYPLNISVAGLTSAVDKVTVTLRNVTHFWPDDLDILLVGPGNRVLLMSDCGLDNAMSDVTLVFDDDATASLPNSDPGITSGTYKPTNFDRLSDTFASPAPPEPYITNLSGFKGLNPNGTWSLYVMDDSPENLGYITDGWTLSLSLSDPLANVGLGAAGTPSSIIVGNTVRYNVAVTNFGPALSPTQARLELPPSFVFVGAIASRGSCSSGPGGVVCDFGNLQVGGIATASVDLAPTLGGTFTNRVVATTTQYDGSPSDNVVTIVTTAQPVADVGFSSLNIPSSALLGQVVNLTMTLTNLGPNTATSVVVTDSLPASLVFVSGTGGTCSQGGGGDVSCAVGSIPSGGSTLLTIAARASALGLATNLVRVSNPQLDFAPANNAGSNVLQILPAADVSLRLVNKRAQAVLNQAFLTEYAISNAGPSVASAAFTNTLPDSFAVVSAVATRGTCTNVNGRVICSVSSMAPNETVIVGITTRGTAFTVGTNIAELASNLIDPVLADNAVTNEVAIIPGADIALSVVRSADPVWLGEGVTYQLRVTNFGPVAATALQLTNRLPAGITFLSMSNTAGTCSENAGLVWCDVPGLDIGSNVLVSIVGRGDSLVAGTNVAVATAPEFDFDLANNVSIQATRVVASSGVFSNTAPITIPDLGAATPYPSTIFVSGLTASVYRVRVGLNGLTHSFPDDLDVLLVGPEGQSTYLMSDAGGEFLLNGAVMTFDDDATFLSDSAGLSSGSWRPGNFDVLDNFPAPAPAVGYATNLTVFTNTNPNGVWSLYIVDDASKDRGTLAGWSLNFATVDPIADLRLTQTISRNPAPVGTNFQITFQVTNLGPATATDVRLTNLLDAALSGISFTSSQGTCTLVSRQLSCSFGSIPTNGNVQVTFSSTPTIAQFVTNIAAVTARETDLRPFDNTRTNVLDFALPPVVTVQPASQTVTNGVNVIFPVVVTGSAPMAFQWFRNNVALAGETNSTLTILDATPIRSGSYQLRATNRVGFVLSAIAVLQVIGPPTLSDIEDIAIDEDTSTPLTPFTVFDFETPPDQIELFVTSSNTNIVRATDVAFTGTGTNRFFRLTPQPNAFGTLTVFFNAKDSDGGVTTLPVQVTVRSVNDIPTLSPIGDLATDEDTNLVINFVATDVETPPDSIQYRIDSDDPGVIASSGAQFTGNGTNRVLTMSPVPNAFGTTTVALVIVDADGMAVSNRFVVAVAAVNDLPTLDALPDIVIAEDSGVTVVTLSGITSGATNEVQNLQVTAKLSVPGIIGPPSISYQSPATNGLLTLVPLPNAFGESVITVTVSDGGTTNHVFSREFRVQVTPVADPPTMSSIPSLATAEDTALTVPFSVSDPEFEVFTLAAFSSDPSLVAAGGFQFRGVDSARTLVITPEHDQFGTVTIQLVATDAGGVSSTNEFLLTVTAVNDPPTLDAVGNLTIGEDSGLRNVPLTGISSGAANESQTLVITASSSNPLVIPSPSIAYTNPAATATLSFTPVANAIGSSTVTVTMNDGQAEHNTFSRSFVVTVQATNDAPGISPISDHTMLEDETNSVAFVIGDPETAAEYLLLSATSSNPTLIAATNISFSGTGSNRFVVLAPRPDQNGSANITVRVTDGTATNSTSFALTVTPVNDRPTLDVLTNLSVTTSPGVVQVPLTGIGSGAANENQALVVTASTANPGFFVNQPNVSYSSPNTTGTLSFRPINNSSGTATISVTVSDGAGGTAALTRSFTLTVRSLANVLPTISLIPPQTINEDTTGGPISFTIRDAETAAGALTLTAFSTNPLLIPDTNIVVGGAAGSRDISFKPLTNQSGVASIVLTVTDGAFGSSNLAFAVTVTSVNDAPTISDIPGQTIAEDSSSHAVPFTIADVETPPALLTVTAVSSAPQLIPNNRIQLGGSGGTRTIQVSPLPEQTGTATITVRVTDGAATNLTTFDVTVTPVDDPPLISGLTDVTLDEDTTSAPVPFTVEDGDSLLSELSFLVVSSNPALVDSSNVVVLAGTGNALSLVITPNTNQFGEALLAVSVSDGGGGSATNSFRLTVNPVNDPPVFDPVPNQRVTSDGVARSVTITGIGAGAANETQLVSLAVSVDRPDLITDLHVEHVLGSTQAVVRYVPVATGVGTGIVTVTADDGQTTNNLSRLDFRIRLNLPVIFGYIPDHETDEDTSASILFSAFDPDGEVDPPQMTAFAENAALAPANRMSIAFVEGRTWAFEVLPGTNMFGVTRIFVVADDEFGARATNSFFLTVRPVIDPIQITNDVPDLTALVGSTPVFQVSAVSVLPLTYQWQYQGADLSGETNSSLSLPTVQTNQAGSYRVVIRSSDASVLSRTATLTVLTQAPAPVIRSIAQALGVATVEFESVAGATCTLEFKASLSDADWNALGSVQGTGGIQTLADPAATDQTRFYRIRVE